MYPKGSRKNSIGFQNNLRKLFIEKQVKNPQKFRHSYYKFLEIQDEINMGVIWGKSPHYETR